MSHSLLIPDILIHIGEHILSTDLPACLLVCKTWHSTLHHLVYRAIVLSSPDDYHHDDNAQQKPLLPPPHSFQHRIRYLRFLAHFPLEYLSLNKCIQLTTLRLDLNSYYSLVHTNQRVLVPSYLLHRLTPYNERTHNSQPSAFTRKVISTVFPSFIQCHASTLTWLTLSCEGLLEPPAFWSALESCIHLAGLELFSLVVPSIRATSFWKVCSGLKCLGFFHCAIPEIPGRVQVDPSVLQNNMLAPLQSPQQQQQQQQLREKDLVTCFPRLEKLYWQQVLDFSETSFVQLLKTMPSLKSLSWQTSRDNTSNTLSASESMVVGLGRHAEFGHFKHLHSLELSDPQCTDQALSAILSCLSNLTVLSVPGTGFGPLAFQALKQTRVLYNLKELVLEDCDAVTSTMIQEIMTRCTELEVLEAGILYSSDILSSLTAMDQENGHVIDNDDNDGKDATSWACVKLKRLAVTIAMNSISAEQRWRSAFWQSQNRWRMKARVKDQKRVLAKLATLTRLEYLELRGTARVEGRWGEQDASISSSSSSSSSLPLDCVLDLQLQKGLDQLAPLVQLCEFQVPSCAQHMDILEIEWMLEQWPLLQRVSGQFNVNRIVNNELTQILNDRGIAS